MSGSELKQMYLGNVRHVKKGDSDIIKGNIYSLYPKKAYFSDKYNYRIFHQILIKDTFNFILMQEKFPSVHENLAMLNEVTYFIPTVWYITAYYFIIYNYQLRISLKSNFKGHLYSLAIPIIGSFAVSLMNNAGNAFYEKYLSEEVFASDAEADLKKAKILSFRLNSIQYNDYLYRYHLNERKVLYTDNQILSTDITKRE